MPDGTLRFYGAAGIDYGEMANVGASIHWTSRKDPAGRYARVFLNPTGFVADYGTPARRIVGLSADGNYAGLAGSGTSSRIFRDIPPGDGFENRHFFVSTAGTENPIGDDGPSVLYYYPRRAAGTPGANFGYSGNVTDYKATLRAPTNISGFVFDDQGISVVGFTDSEFGPIAASGFDFGSSALMKTEPKELDVLLSMSPVGIMRTAPTKAWQYLSEVRPRPERPGVPLAQFKWNEETSRSEISHYDQADWTGPQRPARWHFSPIAEDLERISPLLVKKGNPMGTLVDLRDLVGITWAGVIEVDDKVDQLEERVQYLERKLRGNVIDVE